MTPTELCLNHLMLAEAADQAEHQYGDAATWPWVTAEALAMLHEGWSFCQAAGKEDFQRWHYAAPVHLLVSCSCIIAQATVRLCAISWRLHWKFCGSWPLSPLI